MSSPPRTPPITQPAIVTPGNMTDERIDEPKENDVLCGRGGSINSHKGNEFFRNLVEKRKRVYLTARFKREKRLIASSIVSEIRNMDPPGRFLARKGGKETGYWYDIGDEKARDKTSQALRENAPSIRAEIETEINQQREEMKKKEDEEMRESVRDNESSPPSHFPPPPHSYYAQQYWDWYYHYYGYGHPPPPGHYPPPPPPPHGAPPAPGAVPSHPHHPPPPPPPPGYHWGSSSPTPRIATSRSHDEYHPPRLTTSRSHEEYKEPNSPAHESQEEKDKRLAMALQYSERQAAFEDRKRHYENDSKSRAARSSAFVSFDGHQPVHRGTRRNPSKQAKIIRAAPFNNAMDESRPMSQEERDHRLAVALQEQEDKAARHHLELSGGSSRRTSRSNAYSQVRRATRGAVMDCDAPSAFEQMVPSSIMAWTRGGSFTSGSDPETARKEKAKTDSDHRRAVQFKEDSDITTDSLLFRDGNVPPPQHHNRDMAYSPINLHRENSVVDAASQHLPPHLPPANPGVGDNGVFSQVANHLIGAMGSWDPNSGTGTGTGTTGTGLDLSISSGYHRVRTQPPPPLSPDPSIVKSDKDSASRMAIETEGQEVRLIEEARDESMMPPPEPRVQIDWPSRVGSCHGWIPDTIGAAGAPFFAAPPAVHPPSSTSSARRGSYANSGISPVNSLEMDGSANEHLSCAGSVGGGSLCNVFEPNPEDVVHRALHQVPSWERNMRSKSPLSVGSVDEDHDSMICVRQQGQVEKPPPMTPIRDGPEEMDTSMEWDGQPE